VLIWGQFLRFMFNLLGSLDLQMKSLLADQWRAAKNWLPAYAVQAEFKSGIRVDDVGGRSWLPWPCRCHQAAHSGSAGRPSILLALAAAGSSGSKRSPSPMVVVFDKSPMVLVWSLINRNRL
jgi:hypothetical protein